MGNQEKDTGKGLVLCVNAILEKKGKDLTVMKVRELSSFADYFLICSGTSVRQTQAIAESIQLTMKTAGRLPRGVEGEQGGTWILLDYHDIIVHVFYEPTREFYGLENLWSDSPTVRIGDDTISITALPGEVFP
ncbi:MAG: ribosome silencing factor [Smithellaceae bacterium]|nr:ribosome silencing factor [Smithellaceae bacterium]